MKRDIETGNIGTTKAMCLVHEAGPGGPVRPAVLRLVMTWRRSIGRFSSGLHEIIAALNQP